MSTEVMSLNNAIANLKHSQEEVDDERNRIKSSNSENSKSQMEKITQLARILMAIDHLEGFCKYKKLQFNKQDKVATGLLGYDTIRMQQDETRRKQFLEIMNSFDSYTDRIQYALDQLTIIGQYISDFEIIIGNITGKTAANASAAAAALKKANAKKDEKVMEVIPEESVAPA